MSGIEDKKKTEGNHSQEEIPAAVQEANEAPENSVEPADESAPSTEPAGQDAEYQPVGPQQPPAPEPGPRESENCKAASSGDFVLDLLLDIPLKIKVELGRARIQIQELLNLAPGSALKLVKLEGEPVDILANDTLIAKGEVVVQNEKYGIRVTEITSRIQRIRSFSI
jgi:flagellar motor switch protein FliN/FliY